MRNLTTLLLLFSALALTAAPSFNAPATTDIVQGSGDNYIILSDVTDITLFNAVTVTQNPSLLNGTPTIEYTVGNRFALLKFKENGTGGTVKMTVSAGVASKELTINIVPYNNPGITLEVYDIAFWNEVNPITDGSTPVYSEVVGTAECPEGNNAFWTGKWETFTDNLTSSRFADPITESWANQKPVPIMFTTAMTGYFIPPTTGSYTFTLSMQENVGGLFFDPTCTSWKNASRIATENTSSSPISLQAGKVYPIYAYKKVLYWLRHDIKVTGPGISQQIIPSTMLAPLYDITKPNAPTGTTASGIMSDRVQLAWNKGVDISTKIAKIAGYNVYLNGVKKNDNPVTTPTYLIKELIAGINYDFFVTTIDELGNESFPGNVVSVQTVPFDATPPTPPANLYVYEATGTTLKLKWGGAAAPGGSAVVGYDVYVDNVKYNADYIFTDSVFIKGLQPETTYTVGIVAYNSSLVASEMSHAEAQTTTFDPLDYLGIKYDDHRARLNIEKKNISWSEGIGINADIFDGTLYANGGNNTLNKSLRELHPGCVRWGALGANEYAFESATGSGYSNGMKNTSIGTARKNAGLATHAMNMNFCNQIGSYYALCVGIKETGYTVDYRGGTQANQEQVFKNLIEYLAGPATSTYGAIRAAEGFTEPLLKAGTSKGLILEFGNEVWGGSNHNSSFANNGSDYGNWCRNMANAMKTSPYWNDIKDMVYMVYSTWLSPILDDDWGWTTGGPWTNHTGGLLANHKGEVNTMGPSGYIGGNLDYDPNVDYGESVAEYYRLRQEQMRDCLQGLKDYAQLIVNKGYDPLFYYFYESQVSTSGYFGNLGQGVVLNDYLTASMKYGSIAPAIFHINGGEWRITLSDGTPLAHYAIASLVNQHCKGHLVSSNVESNNLLPAKGTTRIDGHDPVGASVYNNGTKWSILLFSRDFDNDYSVQLSLPNDIGTVANAKKYWVTGDGSENGPTIRTAFVTDSIVSDLTITDGMVVTVPKFSMVLYTFEANDPGFIKKKFGHFEFTAGAEGLLYPNTVNITNTANVTFTPGYLPYNYNGSKSGQVWQVLAEDNPHIVAQGRTPSAMFSSTPSASAAGVVTMRSNTTGADACNGVVYIRGKVNSSATDYILVRVVINVAGRSCNVGDKYLDEPLTVVPLITGEIIPVTGVSLNEPTLELTLTIKDSEQLIATIAPVDATNKNVNWSSSDNKVATVSEEGVVTAITVGEATITVTTADGGKTASCEVTVNAINYTVTVTGGTADKATATMGEEVTLTANAAPAGKEFDRWEVTAGGVTIANNKFTMGTANVTVEAVWKNINYAVTGVSLNNSELELLVGESEQLTATVDPANATNKNVGWSSSNNDVATVAPDGMIMAVAVGETIITVTTDDGGFTDDCMVTVTKPMDIGDVQEKPLTAWTQNETLYISGLLPGSVWGVYNLLGALVYQDIAISEEAKTTLPVPGVYIVRSDGKAVKVE